MRYYIKQHLFKLGEQFSIFNSQQEEVFFVKGRLFDWKNRIDLMDLHGNTILYTEKTSVFSFMPEYKIYSPNGQSHASIQMKFSFMRYRFNGYEGRNQLAIEGEVFSRHFSVYKNGQMAASIQKEFSWGDSYVIDIMDEETDLLYLFIVLVIDQIIDAAQRNN